LGRLAGTRSGTSTPAAAPAIAGVEIGERRHQDGGDLPVVSNLGPALTLLDAEFVGKVRIFVDPLMLGV
jgi:hypothetical protein